MDPLAARCTAGIPGCPGTPITNRDPAPGDRLNVLPSEERSGPPLVLGYADTGTRGGVRVRSAKFGEYVVDVTGSCTCLILPADTAADPEGEPCSPTLFDL